MKARLTKRSVEAIKAAERDVLLWDADIPVWDADIPGFGVKVTPKGARIYVLQYSRRDRTKRMTIGRHGDGGLTADQARREAEILRGVIRDGGDPAAERSRQRAIPTMRGLAGRYMAEHATPKKKPRSADSDQRLIDCHILPLLGDRQVSEIGRADLRRFMQDVAAGKTGLDQKTGLRGRRIVRGGKGAANRSLTLLSKMFALAEDWGYRPSEGNPCRMVERFDESAGRERARFMSDAQLARLGEALAAAEARNPMPVNIVRLLLLTGARMGEIVGLRREYLDLGRGLIRLPDSKTGAKVIVLSAPARQLLAELVKDGPETGLLFPGPRPVRGKEAQPYGGLKRFWRGVCTSAQLGDTRIHDLRHTHASVGVAGGFSLLVVGKLLGHSQASTTERYAHLADDPIWQAADVVGNRIAAALAGKSAAVVPLYPAGAGRRRSEMAGIQPSAPCPRTA
jgi:integrase